MMRRVLLLVLFVSFSAQAFEPQVTIRTTVVDFEVVSFVVNCPPGPWGAAFQWDGDKNKLDEELLHRIDEIESKEGVQVKSKTKVKDFAVVEDKIETVSKTTHKSGKGKALCEYIAGSLMN